MRLTATAVLLFVALGVAPSTDGAASDGAAPITALTEDSSGAGSILVPVGWGDGYGEAPAGKSAGGYGGGNNNGSGSQGTNGYGGGSQSDDDTYQPKKKPKSYGDDDDTYQPKKKPKSYGDDDDAYQPKKKRSGYGGSDGDSGPVQPSTGGSGGGNFPATQAACLGKCQKKCMADFVPGSTSQKSCSARCGGQCQTN